MKLITWNKTRINRITVSFTFDQLEHRISHLLREALEEYVPPRDQRQIVNLIHVIVSTIILSLHPVTIQIRTEPIEDLTTELIVLPLFCKELEQTFILEVNAASLQSVQIELKECLQLLVEFTANYLSALIR